MRIVLQRVSQARVDIPDHDYNAQIGHGYVLLLGVTDTDDERHADILVDKLIKLRVWPDEDGKMNNSIVDAEGSMMIISQFTLYADMKKGNRPSYIKAASPDHAEHLYNYFIMRMKDKFDGSIATGMFGENMKISMTNDGPVTLYIDSEIWKNKLT